VDPAARPAGASATHNAVGAHWQSRESPPATTAYATPRSDRRMPGGAFQEIKVYRSCSAVCAHKRGLRRGRRWPGARPIPGGARMRLGSGSAGGTPSELVSTAPGRDWGRATRAPRAAR